MLQKLVAFRYCMIILILLGFFSVFISEYFEPWVQGYSNRLFSVLYIGSTSKTLYETEPSEPFISNKIAKFSSSANHRKDNSSKSPSNNGRINLRGRHSNSNTSLSTSNSFSGESIEYDLNRSTDKGKLPACDFGKSSAKPLVITKDDWVMKKGRWDGSPVILENFKFMFFTVPKNSCEEFKRLFRRMEGYEDWKTHFRYPTKTQPMISLPHNPAINGLKYLYQYSPTEATEMVNDPSWVKAIFFRNPIERFLSAYFDKVVKHTHFQGVNRDLFNISFADFVKQARRVMHDTHFMPQCKLVNCEKWLPHLDFIGNFNNLANDTKRMLEMIGAWEKYGASGWDGGPIFQGKRLEDHATGAHDKLRKFYTPKLENLVRKLLAQDYKHLRCMFS